MFIFALLIATPARADITTGLVGYWKFDEGRGTTVADASGGGNAGTLVGSPTFITGKSGKALSFNGTSQYVGSVGSTSSYSFIQNTGIFTISVWVKQSGLTTDQAVLGNSPGRTAISGFDIEVNDAHNGAIEINVTKGTPGTIAFTAATAANAITDSNWHHIVVVGSGTSAPDIYVDSVVKTSSTSYHGLGSGDSTQDLNIGRTNDTLGVYVPLNGSIDEVRIYNRALTAADVTQLYNQYAMPMDGLVAWWTFDEGAVKSAACGNCVRDPIGNNTGTLSGATKPTFVPGKSGKALSFNGISNFISVASSNYIGTSNASISTWVNFSQQQPDSFGGVHYAAIAGQGILNSTVGFGLFLADDTIGFQVRLVASALGMTSSSTYRDGKWHHIAGTMDRTSATGLKLYIDGVALATTQNPTSYSGLDLRSQLFRIGLNSANMYHFKGSIDDVRIYNRALSAGEVAALYRSGSGPAVRGFNKIKGAARIKF